VRGSVGDRAVLVILLFAVAGCAADGTSASKQESDSDPVLHIDIDLEGKRTTKLTHRVTGVSVSTEDSCQAYNRSPPDIEFLYDFVACTHVAVLMGTATAGTQPPEPEESLCALLLVPDTRLKRTLNSYCTENPKQPVGNAVGLYWDESLRQGSFN
jgi:hypothetical protein